MKFQGYRRDTAGVKSSRRRHLATSRRKVTRVPLMESLEDRTVLSTIVWAGGNGDWHTAANWIGGVRPGANDTAQINDPNVTITHNTGDSDSVGDVQFNGAGATLSVSSGSLVVTGNTSVASNLKNYTQTGGTLDGAGTVNVSGTTTWSGGMMMGVGTTNANGGLTLGGTQADTNYCMTLLDRTSQELRLRRDREELFGGGPNLGTLLRPEYPGFAVHQHLDGEPSSSRATTSRSSLRSLAPGPSRTTAR